MGRRATAGGVEVRGNSLRIAFTYRGEVVRETFKVNGVPLPPTAANEKAARRLRVEVIDAIRQGTFTFERFFPDSLRAAKPVAEVQTFGKLAALWLQSKGALTEASHSQYTNAVEVWKRLLGADTPVPSLTHQTLAALIGSHKWAGAKSVNNYLIVLRGIMAFEYRAEKAALNPMVGIKNWKGVKKKPDPLTADERDRVLADLGEHYDPRILAYFQFAFFTGMRPEELIALRWGDLDAESGTIRVQRVRTFKGSERDGSKTHAERDVDLVGPAVDALKIMEPFTKMKGADIFENPVTGKPWHDERSQRDHYWTPSLKRLGIRHRRAYNTRHTYATVALMRGVNPAYAATQMGHTDLKTFFDRYARWINGADKGVQRSALEAAMGDFSPVSPQQSTEGSKVLNLKGFAGRRDWTRTKARGRGG